MQWVGTEGPSKTAEAPEGSNSVLVEESKEGFLEKGAEKRCSCSSVD